MDGIETIRNVITLDFLKQIIESVNDGIWVTDKQDIMVFMNDEVEHIAGVNLDQCSGLHVLRDFPEEALGEFKKYYQLAKDTLQSVSYELAVKTPAGRNKIQQGKLSPIIENDSYNGMVCTIHDVAENTQTEHNLEKEKKRAERYLHLAGTMLISLNTKGEITLLNKKGYEILGYEEGELFGKNWFDTCLPSEIVDEVKDVFQQIMNGDIESVEHYDNPIIQKDGKQRLISWHNSVLKDDDGNIIGLLSSGEDVTERKEMEAELKASEERFALAMEATKDGLYDWDLTTNEIYYSPGWKRMLGYENNELPNDFSVWEKLTDPNDVKESWKMQNELINKKRDRFEIIFKMKHKDGHWVHILSRANAIFDDQGKAVRIIGTHVDISEKIKAEKKLIDSEKKFRTLFNSSSDAIFIHSLPDEKIVDVNDETLRRYGYTKEELLNLTIDDLSDTSINSTKSNESRQFYQKLLDGETIQTEWCSKRKNGETFWHLMTLKIVEIEGEKRLLAQAKDIDEMVRSRNKLAESEENYRTIFETAANLITSVDKDGIIQNCNDQIVKFLGYEREEIIGQSMGKIIHPDYMQKAQESLREILKTGFSYNKEYKMVRKDGNLIDVIINSSGINKTNGSYQRTICIINDVTERNKAVEALKISERKYRGYIDNAPNGVFICDEHGKYLEVNNKAVETTGYSKDELLTMNITDILPEDGKEIGLQHFQSLLKEGKCVGETPFVHKNGTIRWWQINAIRLFENRFLGFTQDITEKREVEHKLQRIFNMSSELICEADINTATFTKINPAFLEVLGYSEEELLNHSFLEFIHPDDIEPTQKVIDEQLQKGEKVLSFINRYRCKDGSYVWLDWNSHPVPEKGFTYAIARDITKQKQAEKELRDTHEKLIELNKNLEHKVEDRTQKIQELLIQKDEMINQMGHDLKNPLGPIINLMPILMKHEKDPKKLEMMDAVHKSAEYMKNLVVKSIKLAKINSNIIEFNYEPVVLSDEISDICKANKLLFNENHMVIDNQVNSDFLVNADKLQLHELINNLLNNAVKYSENGGTVLIQAQENDDMIHVSIKDQGIGMTEEQMSKIFDEFYKADFSRHDFDSSGLGMPICKRIVEKHGGKIWAESEGIGKGSTIHFTLPKK